jgi:hypothetical protein
MHRQGDWIYAKTWYVVQRRYLWFIWIDCWSFDWEDGAKSYINARKEIDSLKG